MVTSEVVDVLFVVMPYDDSMTIPRAFALRMSPDGMAELINAIETGLIRAYRVERATGGAEYVAATVKLSPYGFVQMEVI